MLQLFLGFILKIIATLVQIVCLPFNAIINATMPDLADKILYITNNISVLFTGLRWAVGILPPIFTEFLVFIITVEIAFQIISKSTMAVTKIWNIIKNIKFW